MVISMDNEKLNNKKVQAGERAKLGKNNKISKVFCCLSAMKGLAPNLVLGHRLCGHFLDR